MSDRRYQLFSILMIAACAIPSAFIDFPAGDSWTHGWTVNEWLKGNFVLNDWASALAIPQQVLGYAVNLGRDEVSWRLLAVLTSVVTMIGILIAAKIPSKIYPDLQELNDWSPIFAVGITSCTFTMKVLFGFMTDGYYLFFMVMSVWILVGIFQAGEKVQSTGMWLLYSFLALLATLQRTHGIFLFVVPVIWIIYFRIFRNENKTEKSAALLPLIILIFGLTCALIIPEGLSTERSGEVLREVKDFWTGKTMGYGQIFIDRISLIFGILQHLGLALFPFVLLSRLEQTRKERKTPEKEFSWLYVILGTAFILLTFYFWGNSGRIFPYLENSLTPEGFGPRADTLALTSGHILSPSIRGILTVLSTLGGMSLIWVISRILSFKSVRLNTLHALIGTIGLAHFGILFLNPHFFDRYLIPLLPYALIMIAPMLKGLHRKFVSFSLYFVLVMLLWSVWGTCDYLMWTKSKWEIGRMAMSRGIESSRIVAGYEFDGFYNFSNENYPRDGITPVTSSPLVPWWVKRLGLEITPEFVVVEKGAKVEGSIYKDYVPTGIENWRMRLLGRIGYSFPHE